jgi:2-dehydropantoate 2-reductase
MTIKKVSIIGLGALGVLYAHHLSKIMPKQDLRIVADQDRINRYVKDKIYSNGEICDFQYVAPEQVVEPANLLVFAVKFNNLKEAIEAVRGHVDDNTIIISLLNGIASEEVIGRAYGLEKIVYCVAQGMDAVKVENSLTYANMGLLCIGDREPGLISDKTNSVDCFMTNMEIPHAVETQMYRKLWSKFMANVGINQSLAVFGGQYKDVQMEGEARDVMIAAMREVIVLSEKEGIFLDEDDLQYWLKIISQLSSQGKPSMRQDVEAQRYSELELFSGTVLDFGKKHDIQTPVNLMLYKKIKDIENTY